LIENERPSQYFGHSLPRQIVQGRSDAARRDNKIRPAHCISQRRLDSFQVVADGGFIVQIQAYRRQLLGHMGRIGVHDLSQQKLRSNGNDFCFQSLSFQTHEIRRRCKDAAIIYRSCFLLSSERTSGVAPFSGLNGFGNNGATACNNNIRRACLRCSSYMYYTNRRPRRICRTLTRNH
jgi:hypothetical protein